jgi:hypothetical protein
MLTTTAARDWRNFLDLIASAPTMIWLVTIPVIGILRYFPNAFLDVHHRVIMKMAITTSPSRNRRYFVRTLGFVMMILVCPTFAWVARVCLINFGMGLSLAARDPFRLL